MDNAPNAKPAPESSRFLRQECGARGWTQADLIRRLALSGAPVKRSRVSAWFVGDARPEPTFIARLCEVLRLDPVRAAELYRACDMPLPACLHPSLSGV